MINVYSLGFLFLADNKLVQYESCNDILFIKCVYWFKKYINMFHKNPLKQTCNVKRLRRIVYTIREHGVTRLPDHRRFVPKEGIGRERRIGLWYLYNQFLVRLLFSSAIIKHLFLFHWNMLSFVYFATPFSTLEK